MIEKTNKFEYKKNNKYTANDYNFGHRVDFIGAT